MKNDRLNKYDFERLPITVQLIAKAIERHGVEIAPSGLFSRFRDCLYTNDVISTLWYNDKNGNIHIVKNGAQYSKNDYGVDVETVSDDLGEK